MHLCNPKLHGSLVLFVCGLFINLNNWYHLPVLNKDSNSFNLHDSVEVNSRIPENQKIAFDFFPIKHNYKY